MSYIQKIKLESFEKSEELLKNRGSTEKTAV